MTDSSDLTEQQILKHEAHLKHVDELFTKADEVSPQEGEDPLLAALKSERNTLEALLKQMRHEGEENWQETEARHFGPLAIWEALARVLERKIESHEKS